MTVRTANDFNKEYLYKCWCGEIEAAGKPTRGKAVKNVAFYGVLTVMVLLAFFYSGNKNPGKRFGPFAYNQVLTPSMQSVYPQGSLIASWAIKQDEPLKAGLENGTDIVYVKNDGGEVVVHRIIEIYENYEDSGQRAFITQGVNNLSPDPWITYEGNVIGKVTWHIPFVGDVLAWISKNILLAVGLVVFLSAVISVWKAVLKKEVH